MVERNTEIYKFLKKCETPPNESFFWIILNFLFNSILVFLGKFLIVLLRRKDKGDPKYVLMSSKNMGDMLFLYRSLEELKRLNNFKNFIIIADGMFRKPLEALGIDYFHITSFWKIMAMDKVVQLYPNKYKNMVVSPPWNFYGVKSVNSHVSLLSLPCNVSDVTLNKLFPLEVMKGKTVVLSPYEQTISVFRLRLLSWDFWTMLAENLKKRGFFVLTNCNGKSEKPIEGTDIFFPMLGELAGAVQYAGYCVSMRSGFTDWISSAQLKKEVVLYPTKRFFEYYNLNLLWDKNSALEYIYGESNMNTAELVEMIVNYLLDGENHL